MVKRSTAIFWGAPLLAASWCVTAGTACFFQEEQWARLYIEEVTVVDEYDGVFVDPQIEVHAFDAETAQFLGCAASREERSRFLKSPQVMKEERSPGKWLTDFDIVDRHVLFVVTENDDGACPSLYSDGIDDIVGVSAIIPGGRLDPGMALTFDRVTHLFVGLQ